MVTLVGMQARWLGSVPSVRLLTGDALTVLRTLPAESAQCCVTSPPYYGLRDYGIAGQVGMEDTPEAYVARMVEVFSEVRRVLRPDATLWLNIGDSFANDGKWGGATGGKHAAGLHGAGKEGYRQRRHTGLKPKDMIGIPWMVAFALRADGWWLRSDIIWSKPNPMPESVTDRPTRAHEYVFLLSKAQRYFYDRLAIVEPWADERRGAVGSLSTFVGQSRKFGGNPGSTLTKPSEHPGHNARSVWSFTPQPCREAHFATMPPALAERCILAGSRGGDTVLDPFSGAGTTAMVAARLGRDAIGIELNPAYQQIAECRVSATCP